MIVWLPRDDYVDVCREIRSRTGINVVCAKSMVSFLDAKTRKFDYRYITDVVVYREVFPIPKYYVTRDSQGNYVVKLQDALSDLIDAVTRSKKIVVSPCGMFGWYIALEKNVIPSNVNTVYIEFCGKKESVSRETKWYSEIVNNVDLFNVGNRTQRALMCALGFSDPQRSFQIMSDNLYVDLPFSNLRLLVNRAIEIDLVEEVLIPVDRHAYGNTYVASAVYGLGIGLIIYGIQFSDVYDMCYSLIDIHKAMTYRRHEFYAL